MPFRVQPDTPLWRDPAKCPHCHGKNVKDCFEGNLVTFPFAVPREIADEVQELSYKVAVCEDCLVGFTYEGANSEQLETISELYVAHDPFQGRGVSFYSKILEMITRNSRVEDPLADIGCGDGYLLEKLNSKGFKRTIGIESATPEMLASKPIKHFILMHILEHLADPFKFLKMLIEALPNDGKIFIEVSRFTGFNQFHLFFFTTMFFKEFAKREGLSIMDYEVDPNQIRICLGRGNELPELNFNNSIRTWSDIFGRIEEEKRFLRDQEKAILRTFEEHPGPFYWWGSGATSIQLLFSLPESLIHEKKLIVIDGDSRRWGRVIPKVNMEIHSYSKIRGSHGVLFVASSFLEEIKQTLSESGIRPSQILPLAIAPQHIRWHYAMPGISYLFAAMEPFIRLCEM